MAAYIIADVAITNPEQMAQYRKWMRAGAGFINMVAVDGVN